MKIRPLLLVSLVALVILVLGFYGYITMKQKPVTGIAEISGTSSMPDELNCSLSVDRTEVPAGETVHLSWTSQRATHASLNYFVEYHDGQMNAVDEALPPQGAKDLVLFDAIGTLYSDKALSMTFYGPSGEKICMVPLTIVASRTLTFPAPLVKIKEGDSVVSVDEKYSFTLVRRDEANNLLVTVRTPNEIVTNQIMKNTYGAGVGSLNVKYCGGITPELNEFVFSLGTDLLPQCVNRNG